MGKGDQRSKRGKTWIGTFGKRRPRRKKKAPPVNTVTKGSKGAKKS